MKKLFSFCAVTITVLSLGLSSCTKEDPAKPLEVDWNRTGTVEGTILYVNDETTTPKKYAAPSSLEISATIPYSDLNSGASGTYSIPKSNITYTGSTGKFSVKVPVGVNGADVTIRVSSFTGTRREDDGGTSVTVNGIWSLTSPATISANNVQQDQTTLVNERTLTFTAANAVGDDV